MKGSSGKWLAVLWLACVAVVSVPTAMAQQQKDNTAPSRLNKAQAAERAKQQVNGRVLKVDQKANQYRVKVLKDTGRVVSVDVDKRSGQVKPTQEKGHEQ